MTETLLDSLVVRIGADVAGLEKGIAAADTLAATTEKAAQSMAGAFEGMARRGAISFDNLKASALSSLAEMAAGFLSSGLSSLLGGGSGSGFASIFLPGRAGGGSVTPRQPYVVGERGPELFVPEGSGRIDPHPARAATPRAEGPRITINVNGVREERDLRQSATQVAVAVNRAMARAQRGL